MKKETLIEFVEKVNELNEFIKENRITALTILDPQDSSIHFIDNEDYNVIENALNPKITNLSCGVGECSNMLITSFKLDNLSLNKTNYLKKENK